MHRVCMVAYSHYPLDPRIRREAEAISEKCDTVDVICLRKEGQSAFEIINNVNVFRLSIMKYRGASTFLYLLTYFQFFNAASFKLLFRHLKRPYQVIQVHTMPDFLVFCALIPKLLGSKVILDVHDLVPELYSTKFGLPTSHWLIRLLTWVEKISIGFADRAIAVSKPHLNALARHGNPADKFTILLNLPDTKFISHKASCIWKDRKEFKIIYHGNVTRRYGLDGVIRALTCLQGKVDGLKFSIIGVGDELPQIQKLVKDLSVEDYVSIQDTWMSPEEYIPFILDADVGIVPLLDDEFTKNTMPIKLLEYVALGRPVICSKIETVQNYFDDTMVEFFTPGNVTELADVIYALYKNPDKREQLVLNADKFNREYNWERQKQAYYRMVDELVKPNLKAG